MKDTTGGAPDRAPPHSPEIEVALLGGCMTSDAYADRVIEGAPLEAFHCPSNRQVMAAIMKVRRRGLSADPLTVAEELSSRPAKPGSPYSSLFDQLGGRPLLAGLVEQAPMDPDPGALLQRLRELAACRKVVSVCRPLLEDASRGDCAALASRNGDLDLGAIVRGAGVGAGAEVRSFAEIERETVTWLWTGRLARGKLTMLDGQPGAGKSTMACYIAAALSRGEPLPGDDYAGTPAAATLLVSSEDGAGDTIRPRLEAAGADLERVFCLTGVQRGGTLAPLILPDDFAALEEAVRASRAVLVVIDPVMAHLNTQLDSHRDQHVRVVLARLSDMAQRTGAAVLLIRHLRKTGGPAIGAGQGSIGFTAASRSTLVLASDEQQPDSRYLAIAKCNLVRVRPTLEFRAEEHKGAPRLVFVGERDDLRANDLTDGSEGSGGQTAAREFLQEVLANGPVPSQDVTAQAREQGVSERTLARARKGLRVKCYRDEGKWWQSLPGASGLDGV